MRISEMVTAPRPPYQNAYVERVIGSIRRCLDQILVVNERHLHCVLTQYVNYYHRSRTRLSLDKDCPWSAINAVTRSIISLGSSCASI